MEPAPAPRMDPTDLPLACRNTLIEPQLLYGNGLEEFRFSPSAPRAAAATSVHIELTPLTDASGVEPWRAPWPTQLDATQLLAHASITVNDAANLQLHTRRLYDTLITRLRACGFPHLQRAWNLIPDINHGDGDDEHYVRFCLGRSQALTEMGFAPHEYPAGTAVGGGTRSMLQIVLLAGQSPALAVENPRQTSAWQYPRQFGPRPPTFSRATLVRGATGAQLYISGTGSVVGHASLHQGLRAQLRESLANIDTLLHVAQRDASARIDRDHACWRVYLRQPQDCEAAQEELVSWLGAQAQVVFLHADICRRELLVEIEGVCAVHSAAP